MNERESIILSSSEQVPSRETLSDGPYKYIFYGSDNSVVLYRIVGDGQDKEHRDISPRRFDRKTDDAGRLNLTWPMSTMEIRELVEEERRMSPDFTEIDLEDYRSQLEINFRFTRIRLRTGILGNATSLGYREINPATRMRFKERLSELFPGAAITEDNE